MTAPTVLRPGDLGLDQVRRLLLGGVVPRPIAWVSTTAPATGVPNLAPFSYFSVLSTEPPMLGVTIEPRDDGGGDKDTLANLRAGSDLVINTVPEELGPQMWITSHEHPAEVDEFTEAGVAATGSCLVRAPRVRDAPLAMECVLDRLVPLGGAVLVVARVLAFHVRPGLLDPRGRIRHDRMTALGRIGGEFLTTTDSFALGETA
jgi:flavin reductase (DIM6/NTAB) family NADH-FMN oxidoreductase RutF